MQKYFYIALFLLSFFLTVPPDCHAYPIIKNHHNGEALLTDKTCFSWDQDSLSTNYRIKVGTTWGGSELQTMTVGNNLIAAVANLPTDDSIIYVTLEGYRAGSWYVFDVQTLVTGSGLRDYCQIVSFFVGGLTGLAFVMAASSRY